MGRNFGEVSVPGLEDPLRTICIDLTSDNFTGAIESAESFKISIFPNVEERHATASVVFNDDGNEIPLNCRSLNDLSNQFSQSQGQ